MAKMLSRVAPWLASASKGRRRAPGRRRPRPGRRGHRGNCWPLAPRTPSPTSSSRPTWTPPARRRPRPGGASVLGRVRRRRPPWRLLGRRQPGAGRAGPRARRPRGDGGAPLRAPLRLDLRPRRDRPGPLRGLEQLGQPAHEVRRRPAAHDHHRAARRRAGPRAAASASWRTSTRSCPPARRCSRRNSATRRYLGGRRVLQGPRQQPDPRRAIPWCTWTRTAEVRVQGRTGSRDAGGPRRSRASG